MEGKACSDEYGTLVSPAVGGWGFKAGNGEAEDEIEVVVVKTEIYGFESSSSNAKDLFSPSTTSFFGLLFSASALSGIRAIRERLSSLTGS